MLVVVVVLLMLLVVVQDRRQQLPSGISINVSRRATTAAVTAAALVSFRHQRPAGTRA